MGSLRKIAARRDMQVADLRRFEQGCAVRGCGLPTAYQRPVEIRPNIGPNIGPTGGYGRLVVLGYCQRHLDQINAFKAKAAAA